MKKIYLIFLFALPLMLFSACGDDDESGSDGGSTNASVVVKDDGTTSNGSIFSAVDDKNFYLDYIKYTVEEGHLVVSGYDRTGLKEKANIVSKITYKGNSYEVLGIRESAFVDCKNLTSVTIPNSVTSIGSNAFFCCIGLTSITIPNSVTSIGSNAFGGCNGLTSIIVEKGNPFYDSRDNCNAIIETSSNALIIGCDNTTIPNNIASIGFYAFHGCTGLKEVTVPNSVTSIGSYAFHGCTGLTSITIPHSVTSIGENAFTGCTDLKEVTINSDSILSTTSPSSPSMSAYFGAQVTSYIIGDEVTNIGYEAFQGCTGLTSITIGNSVTSIGSYAFHGCTGLTSITIPGSVTSIGWGAFQGCTGLTSITIPKSVTSIGSRAFRDCTELKEVTINSDSILSTTSPSSLSMSAYFGAQVTSYIIGDEVTKIGYKAFEGCTGLTSITIGNSVTSIGFDAFYGCTGLTSITISNSVTSIGPYAFGGCTGLTSITIGNSVTSIEYSAFSGCKELADFYCYAEAVPKTESNTFYNTNIGNVTLHVPVASIEAYKAEYPWSDFKSIVALE